MAGSGFPPLPNIPYCCLPQESGPCLSTSVGDRPLRSPTHRGLGGPSPRPQANGTHARPRPNRSLIPERMPSRGTMGCYPAFPPAIPRPGVGCIRVTHPSATLAPRRALTVRLACIRPAASVHPEPGSNSSLYHCTAHSILSWIAGLAVCSYRLFFLTGGPPPGRPPVTFSIAGLQAFKELPIFISSFASLLRDWDCKSTAFLAHSKKKIYYFWIISLFNW